MAGTTVRDFDNVHEAIQEALANHDIFVTRDEVNEVMGLPKPVAIEALLKNELSAEMITEGFIETIYQDFVSIMIDFYENDPMIQAKEGAEQLFRLLKTRGIKVAIDTGFSRLIADTIIKRLRWREKELIDYSVTSDEVERGRPFPDMILKAMEYFDISDASEVAKVGDTISDMEEGKAAGCQLVIGVTSGAYTQEELTPTPHTHLIEKLDEIPEIIGIPQYNPMR
jgi:phosphonatase-like hydrolase